MPRAYLRASGSKHVPHMADRAPGGADRSLFRLLAGGMGRDARHVRCSATPPSSPGTWRSPGGRVEAFRMRAHASGRAATLLVFVDDSKHGHEGGGGSLSQRSRSSRRAARDRDRRGSRGQGAWNAASLSHVPRLVSGRSYWLTVLGEGGALRYRARLHGRCLGESKHQGPPQRVAGRLERGTGRAPRALPDLGLRDRGVLLLGLAFPRCARFPRRQWSTREPDAAHDHGPVGWGVCRRSRRSRRSLRPPNRCRRSKKNRRKNRPKKKPRKSRLKKGPSRRTRTEEEPTKEPAPHNSVVPAIGGTLTVGDVLSTTKGTWSGSPTSYAYRWQDCDASGTNCANISGATVTTYTLKTGDVGHTIRVVVTATNEGGSTSATSAATAAR